MNLKVVELSRVLINTRVKKVVAEDEQGYFGMLPRHADFITALVPGILTFETQEGGIQYVALDEGILVKAGDDVMVSTARAVRGEDLIALEETVRKEFSMKRERAKKIQAALSRLEADLARRFVRFGRRGYE
ncbi:MAG: F0F1 ATP synthase subunit epsilon [Desulfomonilia bacterium]|jgi:F-type H+-transporting ATPase subunit epsilon|uniref:ATP synthase epsilon chain n=1 Tax=anaerobic digester metagenome TaxID=1263854 RepID=A0A485M203_9ZZZZ|nr:F0F1 ATP synthase subunit epsilon [Pseudomonadota bacterium]HPD20583.1 F0F1 ATP synthase subunit epsilon [Deltaproteobacteria bacterium]HPX17313.1 F0F1 ATP synthase subunit epsilon [Deltaproteobacteria bacterium]HRS55495.1 F0F1 ATP synthase subunit epsilon [Desulfomonilia bacterium]HRV35092.1 F0F1 ATP synthase subunit epsilon [Desulfomonilia bacterium]